MFPIRFRSLTRLENELKSKLLDPESNLYKKLREKRNEIIVKYNDRKVSEQRIDFHIELINKSEYDQIVSEYENKEELDSVVKNLLEVRTKTLDGFTVNMDVVKVLGKALVIPVELLHITLVHFPDGAPEMV